MASGAYSPYDALLVRRLARAVLGRAFADATAGGIPAYDQSCPARPTAMDRDQARAFLLRVREETPSSLAFWCRAADISIERVVGRARRLQRAGWVAPPRIKQSRKIKREE